MHDQAAAARLMAEVQSRYQAVTGERFTKTGLSDRTGISRPTLDNWLEHGVMPPQEGMHRLAAALEAPPAQLWMRWLGLGSSGLDRIADELAALRQTISEAIVPAEEMRRQGAALDDAVARLGSLSSPRPHDHDGPAEG